MTDEVLVETRPDGITLVTLNRPEHRNTVTGAMLRRLGEVYRECDADDAVRAVVLTGAGNAFCAGADFSAGKQPFAAPGAGPAGEPRRERFESSPVRPPAWEVRKPVIAAVNGHAIGIGMTLVMQCDFRIMAREAKWGIVQVRRGVVPDAQSHFSVPRAIGFAHAAEILLTGRTFTGADAERLGVAMQVLPSPAVLPAAIDLAEDLAANCAPLSYAMSKRILWQSWASAERVDELEREAHLWLMGRPDALEGPRAFLEKRAPNWSGSVAHDWPTEAPTD